MGIIGISILVAFSAVLKGAHIPSRQIIATQAATKCADWYLGQRYLNGFNAAALICPSTNVPSICTTPSGYTIAVDVACTSLYSESAANYKTITISIAGNETASLSLLLAKY